MNITSINLAKKLCHFQYSVIDFIQISRNLQEPFQLENQLVNLAYLLKIVVLFSRYCLNKYICIYFYTRASMNLPAVKVKKCCQRMLGYIDFIAHFVAYRLLRVLTAKGKS